jgi:EAL domain-containing protein (putative c-di-GMP-specific phosphodiesterase class I)
MYRAKEMGRNTYQFYSEDLNVVLSRQISLEADLRQAFSLGEFELFYQPRAELATGKITGAEALLRWRSPTRGLVPPDEFISTLEETGLIIDVGEWVLENACRQAVKWNRGDAGVLNVAVNLSARQFRQKDLADKVREILRATGLPPDRLELELTESVVMQDTETAAALLRDLADIGVHLAVDDFGTGYSSLSYLKVFNMTILKIDKSFVRDIPGDPDDCAIASAIVALGHSLRLRIVAEGVENEAQARYLAALGCDEMQGYLLSKPLPAADFEKSRRTWEANPVKYHGLSVRRPATPETV